MSLAELFSAESVLAGTLKGSHTRTHPAAVAGQLFFTCSSEAGGRGGVIGALLLTSDMPTTSLVSRERLAGCHTLEK
jgi:hypothetical protein